MYNTHLHIGIEFVQHTQFYRYISNAFDTPPMRLHFNTDVPIAINALFYIPERHMEKFGMGRMDPGVSLYSRKVLISPKSKLILPEWLRFIKGVVDSEDIPLNISRENMQDSALITRINNILTKRVIKFLESEAKRDPKMYNNWLEEFGRFLKEGVVQDFTHKNDIARLLRFDSSRKLDAGERRNFVSLDDYIAAMPVGQKDIYFLSAPSRDFAESSPYYESFRAAGTEVLFLYAEQLDDIVMRNLGTYETRRLISIESEEAHENKADESADHADLLDFVQETLSDRVSLVKASTRLSTSPALVVDHESGAIRRMMKMVDNAQANLDLPKQKLEINPNHPIIRNAFSIRWEKPEVATLVLQQVYDNALIAADLLDNPRTMIERLNKILEQAAMPSDEAEIVEEEETKAQ
jgi:HSP90 family molecular chaperone